MTENQTQDYGMPVDFLVQHMRNEIANLNDVNMQLRAQIAFQEQIIASMSAEGHVHPSDDHDHAEP